MPRAINTPRGHSNVHADNTRPYSDEVPDVASIPIEGGATVYTVKPLPALALKREEWETIGQKMGWLPSCKEVAK